MTTGVALGLTLVLCVLQGIALDAMGHPVICKCGFVTLWHGDVFSLPNSRQVTDGYTFGHINQGILFCGLFWRLARRASLNWRAVAVAQSGVIWQVGENTELVLQRFRAVTIALDCFGHSVLNSVRDSVFIMVAFVMARRFPVWMSVLLVLGTEVRRTVVVRDGLALNTLMLLYPIDAVRDRQMAGWRHQGRAQGSTRAGRTCPVQSPNPMR